MTPRRVRTLVVGVNPLKGLVPPDAIGRNNAVSVLLMGALPAVGGSAISLLLNSFLIWGVLSLLLRRFRFEMTPSDRPLAWSFCAFAGVMLTTALIAENPVEGVLRCFTFLPFLSLWAVIPRLRATSDVDYLTLYGIGAAVGSVGALIFALVETGFGLRPEGGAGNAAVFGIMALATASAAALNIGSSKAHLRGLAAAGAFCGIAAAGLSLTRGVWIASLPVVALILFYSPREWLRKIGHPASVTALCLLVGLVAWHSDRFAPRWEQVSSSWQQLLSGETVGDRSMGLRLEMWSNGGTAFMRAPFFGYGVQNRKEVLDVNSVADRRFTHAHNGFISIALDAGIFGLVAAILVLAMPVVTAARAYPDARYRHRLFMALLISIVFAVCGMSQIMFKHDVMDSFYIFSAIVVAASIPARWPERLDRP